MVHSPGIFFGVCVCVENSQPFNWLRVRLFCMALVEQLGDDDRWYVQLVDI